MKKRYDSYKPSGIDWIGDIPSHWKLTPIKHLKSAEQFAFVDGPFGSNLKSEHYVSDGDVYVIESGFITTGKFIYKDFKTITKDHFETIKRSACKGGDIIISKIGYNYGMVGELPNLDKPSVVSGNSLKITLNNSKVLNGVFVNLMNLAKNRNAYIGLVQETAQPALSLGGLNNFVLPIPPLAEQEAIAAWLDEKCGEIDAAIAKVDREIELIDELKQSEISRVVTRGLNPDAPLRPSGIDWIGNIPEHWVIKPLKIHSNIIMGQSPSGNDIKDDGYALFMQGNAEFGDLYPNPTTYCDVCIKHSRIGDILMSVRAPVGELNISDKVYGIGRGLCSIQPYNLNRQFLWYYLLKSKIDFGYFSNGSTFSAITVQTLRVFPITIPSDSEQQAIADYLDKKCAEIDGLKAKLTKKRETLTELRQSIISEVVTGKRKVI